MKISEIIREDISAEEQLGGSESLSSNLLPVLMFLKKRSEDKELAPKLKTDSLISLVQNAGDTTFSYLDLVAAHEDNEAVKNLISNFNEDEIVLKSDDEVSDELDGEGGDSTEEDPQTVVAGMAKKARNNRDM